MAALFLAQAFAPDHCLAQLFEADSKKLGDGKVDIVIREVERRQQVSALVVEIKAVGSSVGASFFLLCSIRQLARERGGARYIAKIENEPKTNRMLIGFLDSREEPFDALGEEFKGLKSPEDIIDLEKFAQICDLMKKPK